MEIAINHHVVHCNFGFVFQIEISFIGIFFRKLVFPVGIEIDGIDQVHNYILGDLVQHVLDLIICLRFDPSIDQIHCLWIGEVCLPYGCIEIILIGLDEIFQYRIALLKPDAVCQGKFHFFAQIQQLIHQILVALIDFLVCESAEMEHIVESIQGGSYSPIVGHAQGIGDAHG